MCTLARVVASYRCNILICRCMQKHIQHNKDERHISLGKYTSHFIRKGYESFFEWEVSWRLNRTATYLPPPNSSGYNNISFLFSWAAQPLAWGPSLCCDIVLIPASSLQLIWTSCRTGLYNNLTSTYFLRALHLHSVQPVESQGYLLMYSTGYTCYLHRCISSLTSRSGRRSISYIGSYQEIK